MFGLDDKIAGLAGGDALLATIGVAILLGLRHATDPDHLVAVSALIASDERGTRKATALGFFWGLGHATTLALLGIPIVLFGSYLPESIQQSAELLIGLLIIGLSVRLLVRWRRGRFHAATHLHGSVTHRHLVSGEASGHSHDQVPIRGRGQAYVVGLVHGVGGSAGVGLLLLASITNEVLAAAALVVFAACTALSMAIASTVFGYTISRGPVSARFATIVPALGAVGLAFGAWYALGAINAVPYYF